jgi:hypothetical protein
VARSRSHAVMQAIVGQQLNCTRGLRIEVTHVFDESIDAVRDQFGHAPGFSADRRDAACHRFERRQAKRFQFAGHQQHVRQRDETFYVILLA